MSAKPPSPAPSKDDSAASDRPRPDFLTLIRLAAEGDPDACQQLYDAYHRVVYYAARRHLDFPLRRIVDSTDINQMVWMTIFSESLKTHGFTCPAQFVTFLSALGRNQTIELFRFHVKTQKRSLLRDEPVLQAGERPRPASGKGGGAGAAKRVPARQEAR